MPRTNARSPPQSSTTLESIGQISDRLRSLQQHQVDSQLALENILIGLTLEEGSSHDTLQKLDTIQGYVQRLVTSNETPAADHVSGTAVPHHLPASDDVPLPVPVGSSPAVYSAKYPGMVDHGESSNSRGDHPPPTPSSSEVNLVDMLYEILSDPPPQPPTLPVDLPPPVSSLNYQPEPQPRSESPTSPPPDLTAFQSSLRLPPPEGLLRLRRRPHQYQQRPSRIARVSEPVYYEGTDHPNREDTSSDHVQLEQRLRQIRSMRLRRIDQASVMNPARSMTSVFDDTTHAPHASSGVNEYAHRDRNNDQSTSRLQSEIYRGRSRVSSTHPAKKPAAQGTHPSRNTPHVPPNLTTLREPPSGTSARKSLSILSTTDKEPPLSIPQPRKPNERYRVRHSHHPPNPPLDHYSGSQQHSRSTPEPTLFQFPPDIIDPAVQLVQEIRAGQHALINQQREAVRYIRDLNELLEHGVRDRMAQIQRMDTRLNKIRDDIRGVAT